jgi:aspartyl-tRNA(Asn)/glutamyl-tRNA(Gln) amidotransferase subunit B
MEYESVIGLEVHVQLSTASKCFCGSSTKFGAEPNQFIDPVTLGLPGCLPVLNKKVVECAIMMGLAMNCEIRPFNRFARKHYFYPDLPKGYQISQFEEPICERGHIHLRANDSERTIGIKRIHIEEDAGKNIHDAQRGASLIDLNRAGVPLLEIVSEPDIRAPAEAAIYLRSIRQIVRFLGISDGNMEEGSLRCDANISLRPVGEMKFGTRSEIKNMNSFKFVERALEYEIARQSAILRSGKEVVQETLLFDSVSGTTRPMRSKEESADYRYFPDPDLPPLQIEDSWIQDVRSRMPKLPEERTRELCEVYGLSSYDAGLLTSERAFADFFEEVFNVCSNAKAACNWITSELFGDLNRAGLNFEQTPVKAKDLGELIKLVDSEAINGKMAKAVFSEMFKTGKPPAVIVKEKGLQQITDDSHIAQIVMKVFEAHPGELEGYLGGNERLHGFFVGQVMKAASGSANPKKVNEVIAREAAKRRK